MMIHVAFCISVNAGSFWPTESSGNPDKNNGLGLGPHAWGQGPRELGKPVSLLKHALNGGNSSQTHSLTGLGEVTPFHRDRPAMHCISKGRSRRRRGAISRTVGGNCGGHKL